VPYSVSKSILNSANVAYVRSSHGEVREYETCSCGMASGGIVFRVTVMEAASVV
jgi:hypothetical protein